MANPPVREPSAAAKRVAQVAFDMVSAALPDVFERLQVEVPDKTLTFESHWAAVSNSLRLRDDRAAAARWRLVAEVLMVYADSRWPSWRDRSTPEVVRCGCETLIWPHFRFCPSCGAPRPTATPSPAV